MSDENKSNKNELNIKDRIFYLIIMMFILNTWTNNELFLANTAGFVFNVIIKTITLLLLVYLIISLFNPLVKKIKKGRKKKVIIELLEYIFIISFFLFLIYDINKILYYIYNN